MPMVLPFVLLSCPGDLTQMLPMSVWDASPAHHSIFCPKICPWGFPPRYKPGRDVDELQKCTS